MQKLVFGFLVVAGSLGVLACEGPHGGVGAAGDAGPAGAKGTPGADGARGEQGEPGDTGATGPAGKPVTHTLPLAAEGLVGWVRDPSGQVVGSGTVYLVPAADVRDLAKQAIDLSLAPDATAALEIDEPLEDLLDVNGDQYQSVAVSSAGAFRFEEVDAGDYFVVFTPSAKDEFHLPGGSGCRKAVSSESLIGTQLDLRVSGRASSAATYVGSGACFGCHGRHRSMGTAHRLAQMVPGLLGQFQVPSRLPSVNAALDAFEGSATLHFYDCDPNRSGDAKCLVSETDPTIADAGAVVSFELRLRRDYGVAEGELGAYTVEIENKLVAQTATYPVVLTVGGSISQQQFLTRRENADGSLSYYALPLHYNIAGRTTYASSDDWPWRDGGSAQWFDFGTSALKEPGNARAFDNNCAGCHMTGVQLRGSASAGFHAHAVPEANGEYDYDGDGKREELNVGCESCHGPASEHLEARVRGVRIVSPSLLTPERENLVCGRCHSRPEGIAGGGTETPLTADGALPHPGLRRSEFAKLVARVDGVDGDFFPSGDSRSSHQQYSDFIRSSMYRNDGVLMACSSCHDAHGNPNTTHDLRVAADDNTACTTCHSGAAFKTPHAHVAEVTKNAHEQVAPEQLVCTQCHMVKTAKSGAGTPALIDTLPKTADAVSYFHGDLASHRFEVTKLSEAATQPVAATLPCANCHESKLPNP